MRQLTFLAFVVTFLSLAVIAGCATAPEELIDFKAATSMSEDQAKQVVIRIAGTQWANDPYVYPNGNCAFRKGYDPNAHIKVSWEDMRFGYSPAPPTAIRVATGIMGLIGGKLDEAQDLNTAKFNISKGKDCDPSNGTIVWREMSPENARDFATALHALGAKPNE